MALESVHACDCSNGFTYVGVITVGKVSGHGGGPAKEEVALSNYYMIATKMLVDRTWMKEVGEDQKEHIRHVPYTSVASALYTKMREEGTLNKKMVRLPELTANHELDI